MKIDEKHNIIMTRGDTEILWVSSPQNPFVEGDILTFTVRATVVSPKMIEKKVADFNWEGKAMIFIEPEDTTGLQFGNYLYDIQWTKADGTVKTIVGPAFFNIGKEVSYDD